MLKLSRFFLLLGVLALLGACAMPPTVKSTTITPVVIDDSDIAEDELLDVGVDLFDPGLDEDLSDSEAELTFADVRKAETNYVSYLLSQTLQSTGNWGVVRVKAHDLESTDVAVRGTILQSDGETMRLRVAVTDATGRVWIDKEYEEAVSKYSYDPRLTRNEDAFQSLYNRIANDMLAFRQDELDREDLLAIRTVARIQFAQNFAPEVYDEYLAERRNGQLAIRRLPAENDPIMERMEDVRQRDNLFVDTMQDHYSTFSRQMRTPYDEFRRLSYDEVMKLKDLKADARRNMLLGVASIIGGLAAVNSSNAAVYYSGVGGLGAGAFLIRDAFGKNDEAQLHVETLAELGNSMGSEIAPRTIELEERTVTLTGNVEAQYEQWREILAEIYKNETGLVVEQEQQ